MNETGLPERYYQEGLICSFEQFTTKSNSIKRLAIESLNHYILKLKDHTFE